MPGKRLTTAIHCTKETLNVLTPAAAMAGLTYGTYQLKENARQFIDPIRGHVKDATGKFVSSVGAALDGATCGEFLVEFFADPAWKYIDNKAQLVFICATAAVGLFGTIVNAVQFNQEQNVMCNGVASGLGASSFKLATSLTSFWKNQAKKQAEINKAYDEGQLAGKTKVEVISDNDSLREPLLENTATVTLR